MTTNSVLQDACQLNMFYIYEAEINGCGRSSSLVALNRAPIPKPSVP